MSGQIIDPKSCTDPAMLDAIFRLRHQVFKERLGWDVRSIDGRERDEFDTVDAVYGAVYDGDGEIEGCFRFLPTTGPYMLKDLFSDLLHGEPAPCDPNILESTRFAVLPREWRHNGRLAVVDVTAQLLITQLSYCLERGIEKVVSVTDVRFERILKGAGLLCERYGPPVRIGKMLAVAGWLRATEENLSNVETAHARIVEMSLPPAAASEMPPRHSVNADSSA